MKIGITCDLKSEQPEPASGAPDDLHEEFDSLTTVEAIAGVLHDLGHEVEMLGDGPELLRKLLDSPPDFVFNIAEGQGVSRSREARVPAALEMLNIPYSGSDPLTLAVTLDKDCAKRLLTGAKHLQLPASAVVRLGDNVRSLLRKHAVPFPAIVKPAWEGSSKGVRGQCVVRNEAEAERAVRTVQADHRQPVLVEEFIAGDELTVGVLGNEPPRVLGVMRVVPVTHPQPDQFVYSLEVKRDFRNQVRYECPPPYSESQLASIEAAALEAFRLLGCRDVARVDFRLGPKGPYFLEVNPLPGLNPESGDLVLMAGLRGWTYERLVSTIFDTAVARTSPPARRARPMLSKSVN